MQASNQITIKNNIELKDVRFNVEMTRTTATVLHYIWNTEFGAAEVPFAGMTELVERDKFNEYFGMRYSVRGHRIAHHSLNDLSVERGQLLIALCNEYRSVCANDEQKRAAGRLAREVRRKMDAAVEKSQTIRDESIEALRNERAHTVRRCERMSQQLVFNYEARSQSVYVELGLPGDYRFWDVARTTINTDFELVDGKPVVKFWLGTWRSEAAEVFDTVEAATAAAEAKLLAYVAEEIAALEAEIAEYDKVLSTVAA